MIDQPLTLPCGAEIPNRLCKAAMTEGLASPAGEPTAALNQLYGLSFQHTGLAVVLQGLVRPRLRGTELEFWRNSEEARTDRPSQQLRSLNGEWRLMRYFLLTHLCGISHRIWCTLSTICSDAA